MATTLTKKEEFRPFFDRFFELDSVMRPVTLKEFSVPALDLYFRDGTYTLEVAMPGLEKRDINIEIDGNCLTISGTYAKMEEDNDKRFHYRELRRGSFSRSVTFPENIDSEKVAATLDRGVLKIEIPSLRPAQPQKVAIK